ncbi:MAG: hypothetical protein D6762_06245 [Candidatus Neomarinimicrobiota bacterium]|nr:MAG: hypothetical protein D6762_06245 [Candidatus Neomarinimicrobiota bacterium]
MSKLWDDLKKNMKEWSNVAVEKAEEVSKIAVAKTEELTRISKIKIEIHQVQKDLESAYQSLGHWIEEKHPAHAKLALFKDDHFQDLMKRIRDMKDSVAAKEAEIARIREESGLEEAGPQEEPPATPEGEESADSGKED